MLRRIRRAQYRSDVNEILDAEEAAAKERDAADGDDESGSGEVRPEGNTFPS